MTDTSTSLLALLCREPWNYDKSNRITFHEDGTGSLICKIEFHIWIAAKLSWHARSPSSLTELTALPLSECDISITLHPNRLESLFAGGQPIDPSRRLNADILRQSAFEGKIYTIQLHAGNFIAAGDEGRGQVSVSPKRYIYKLVFKKSPYPERGDWKKTTGAPDKYKFWERREFVAGKIAIEYGGGK